ncbi:MAG: DNA repair protein RecO [Kiloniellales bacterium]
MHWSDEGIVLSARPHGENAAVVHLLTRGQGRHAGLVRGAQGRRARGVYQPGNLVAAQWSGRLAEHLGSYTCELVESYAARVLDDAGPLAALIAAAAVSERALPEREPHAACFEGFLALLDALTGDHWAEAYVRWELALLAELGFGLDLSACAGGGANDQLAYVSPRTGRAVSLAAGEPYRERLLRLPGFLVGRGGGGPEEVAQGLELTGFFLERHVFAPHHQTIPAARRRLAERFPVMVS